MCGRYARIRWQDEANLQRAVQGIVASLSDPELPVVLDAAFALSRFVREPSGEPGDSH